MTGVMPTEARLLALLDHLGLPAAHFATQIPADVSGLASVAPDRILGLALCIPVRLDAEPFGAMASRLLLISGDKGLTAPITAEAKLRLPAAERLVLAHYDAVGWSDIAAERGDELLAALTRFLPPIANDRATAAAAALAGRSGKHAGLSWRAIGQGPPLVLMPFFLAASQWDPVEAALAERFTVIRLSGPNIGGIAALEERARSQTYRAMFSTLVDLLGAGPQSRVLDVGCGSGVLDRYLVERLGPSSMVDAVDLNPFFLAEATALAESAGLSDRIRFSPGSATALPFADATFDAVFSVTVLEECDADRAIAEMVRVARPGARIGIVVRAIDMAQWWNLDLTPALAAKVAIPPQSIGPGGVADRSLYARMRSAGLVDLVAFPALVTLDNADGTVWRYREDHIRAQLSPAETIEWQAARDGAKRAGLLMQASPLHAAVARKPG